MITRMNLHDKEISELTVQEFAFIHLDTGITPIYTKEAGLRSTLSFINQNIHQGLTLENSKQLMPYLSLFAVLDQLGICYERIDQPQPRYSNGIKRALVYFGELEETNELIDVLYALRNGLLHNVSLTSYDRKKHYRFKYDYQIPTIFQHAEKQWNGDYVLLDEDPQKYSTSINVNKFRDLVVGCIDKAAELNQSSLLRLRLAGGVRQLYYDYIRSVSISST